MKITWLVAFALIPIAATAMPEDMSFVAPAMLEATILTAGAPSVACAGMEVVSVQYYNYGRSGELDLSGLLGTCAWAGGFPGVGSYVGMGCQDEGSSATCSISYWSCNSYDEICWGTATLHEDGALTAEGYYYYEEYDVNGDYFGTSGTSWEINVVAEAVVHVPRDVL